VPKSGAYSATPVANASPYPTALLSASVASPLLSTNSEIVLIAMFFDAAAFSFAILASSALAFSVSVGGCEIVWVPAKDPSGLNESSYVPYLFNPNLWASSPLTTLTVFCCFAPDTGTNPGRTWYCGACCAAG